jgi:hypothetical protein
VNSLTVPVTTLTATDNVAVAAYQVTAASTAPAANDSNWKSIKPASYTFTDGTKDGAQTLYAWAMDTAGNVSPAKTATVTIDTAPPQIKAFTVPAYYNSLTVPVTVTATSSEANIAGYLLTTSATAPLATATVWSATAPVSYKASAAGSITLYAWVKDAVGNVSAAGSGATVLIDLTKPVVTAFTVPSIVNSLTVSITSFTATDAGSGVAGYLITETVTAPLATAAGWASSAPGAYTFATAGAKTLYAWAKDAAGNVSLAKAAAVTVKL